jgi:hypothetical protein
MTKAEKFNELGEQADRLDNLVAGMAMPLPPSFHLEQIKAILPEISAEIKRFVVEQTGEDPWA